MLKILANKNRIIKLFNKKVKSNYKYDLIIITTAITRPELHNISFTNYKEYLPNNISILWIINIDYVDHGNNDAKESLKETQNNIENIYKNTKIDFHFILNEIGNFNNAVRNVTCCAMDFISKYTKNILYLEDDWYINKQFNIIKLMNKNIDAIRLYCTNNNVTYNSFQPSLLKPLFWFFMFYQSLNNNKDKTIDPEKICEKNKTDMVQYNFSYLKYNFFKDIGREFTNDKTDYIRGWFQKGNAIKNVEMTYINVISFIKSLIYKLKLDKKLQNCDTFSINIINSIEELFINTLKINIIKKFTDNLDNYYEYYKNLKINKQYTNLSDIYNYIDNCNEIGA